MSRRTWWSEFEDFLRMLPGCMFWACLICSFTAALGVVFAWGYQLGLVLWRLHVARFF